jgi:hypothetical protein
MTRRQATKAAHMDTARQQGVEAPTVALPTDAPADAPAADTAPPAAEAPPADAPPRFGLVVVGTRQVRVRPAEGDWPSSTDRWCWYCCHPFQGTPLPMPTKYDDKREVFHVMGTFCSWSCMKGFNLDSSSYMKPVNANNIALFHKKCTGSLARIRSAPPRQCLSVFGGGMSIDEFRAGHSREYQVLPERMILHSHHTVDEAYLQQRSEQQLKRAAKTDLGAVVTFKDVSTKNEPLRLKRPKPLQHNRNTLERTMGIGVSSTM